MTTCGFEKDLEGLKPYRFCKRKYRLYLDNVKPVHKRHEALQIDMLKIEELLGESTWYLFHLSSRITTSLN